MMESEQTWIAQATEWDDPVYNEPLRHAARGPCGECRSTQYLQVQREHADGTRDWVCFHHADRVRIPFVCPLCGCLYAREGVACLACTAHHGDAAAEIMYRTRNRMLALEACAKIWDRVAQEPAVRSRLAHLVLAAVNKNVGCSMDMPRILADVCVMLHTMKTQGLCYWLIGVPRACARSAGVAW